MNYTLLQLKNASPASSNILTNLKGTSINKFLFILFMALFFNTNGLYAQNSLNSGDFTGGSWGSGQGMAASAGASLILTKTVGSAGDRYFRFFGDGSPCGEYQPSVDGTFFTNGTTTAVGSSCGGSNAWRINVPNVTDNVIFKTDGSNAGGNAVIFVIGGTAVTASAVSNPGGTSGIASTITATLSASLVSGQGVYLRYTNNNFSSSTVVQMTGSGTSYSADIPSGTNTLAATVRYYVFTSGSAVAPATNGSDADFRTINLNNNSGSNYSYVVAAPLIAESVADFRSKAAGPANWSAAGTWEYNNGTTWVNATVAPVAGNNVTIQSGHTVTLDTSYTTTGKVVTVNGILNTGANVISGTGAVLIDSASAIAKINGAQTYTGNTTIQNGELWIESNAGSIASTNAVAVGAVGAANVTKLWLTNTTGGTTFANNIAVAAGNADTRIIGGLNTSGTNIFSGNINDLSSNFNLYAAGSGINEFSGSINTNGNPIIINQEGANIGTGTVKLSGTNTNTGGTTLRAGTLSVASNASLGTGVITIGNAAISGTLQVTDDTTRNNAIAINSGSSAAAIEVADTKTFTLSGASGILSGATNTTKIGKSGNGTLTLSGPSTYAGQIQVGAGTVVLGNNAGLGTNSTTANRGIDLGLNVGDISTSNNVSVLATGGITVPQSIYVAPNTSDATRTIGLSGSGTATFNNEIFLGGNLTISGGSGSVTIGGSIVNTNGVIVNSGAVIYSGGSTYTGTTTVNSGATLQISAADRISDSSNLVLNGGTFSTTANTTLGHSETLGTLNLATSSTIQLGTGNNHTLTFSNSSGVSWAGALLTITGWSGTVGVSGTAGKIVVGSGGLSPAQLSKIQFTGFALGAIIVSGEVVPNSVLAGQFTQLRPMQCGKTLLSLNSFIQASPVTGATQYRFEVIRTDDPLDIRTITSNNYYFNPVPYGGFIYGKSYTVRVALFIGSWLDYGTVCTITAPNEPVPTITQVRPFQCGKTLSSIAVQVEASPVYLATNYEFEVTSDAGTFIAPSNNYYFSLYYSVPGRALYSTAYSIRVRSKGAATEFTAWGPACVVTTPAAPMARMSDTNEMENIFNVKAFPNPFASHFNLDIDSSSDAQVEMKVYDMIGRQLEVRKSTVSEISVLEVGRNYPSGVYNVVVSQGEKVKTLRMIKR